MEVGDGEICSGYVIKGISWFIVKTHVHSDFAHDLAGFLALIIRSI